MDVQQHSSSPLQLPKSAKDVGIPQSPLTPRGGARRSSHNPAHIDIVVHCPWVRG
jgi:hypothetical protein